MASWANNSIYALAGAFKNMDTSPPSQPQGYGSNPFGNFSTQSGNPFANIPGATTENVVDVYAGLANKYFPDPTSTGTPGAPGTGGNGPPSGDDWAGVNQWDQTINAAAQKYGLDPDQIRAVMKLESNGDPNAAGAPGVWGPMQVYSKVWGDGPWMVDPVANIMKGAEILKSYLDENGGDFREALRGYHGYGDDGNTTDQEYADIVMGNYNTLKAGGYQENQPTTGGGASGSLQTMFGVGTVPDWGEFNVPSGNGLYDYGADYGMNGTNHTGVDVPMAVGSAYYAPTGGTVMCGGTGNGPGTDGGGCAAFNDYFGNGAGRVEVLLDNGAVLIYGHSSTSALQPGQRFNAGALLGTSGGMNSPHIHLEARVRDASTPSGWRIVDPRTVIGGGGGNYGGGAGQPVPATQQQSNIPWYRQSLEQIYGYR